MGTLFRKTATALSLCMLLPVVFASAQGNEKSKTLKKEFTVDKNPMLTIETSYGKVHCNVWDKSQLSVEARVTASARTEKDAQRLLDNLVPAISGNSSLVEIRTKIGDISGSGKSQSFSVDYTVYMPKTTAITIRQRFGDVYIDETSAPATLNIEYGNLTANRLPNPATAVTLKFSNGTIGSFGKIRLDLEYSTFNGTSGNDLDSETRFSTIDLGDLNNLQIDSEYDTFSIDGIDNLHGTAKFSNLGVDQLSKLLDLTVEYGGLDVKKVDQAFELISLNSSFNSVQLGIPSVASYKLNADMSFGDCHYPRNSRVSVTEKSFTSKQISGTVGPASTPSSRVNIRARNCDVKLY